MDVNQLFDMLDKIEKTEENEGLVEEIRTAIEEGEYKVAMDKIKDLNNMGVMLKDEDEEETEDKEIKEQKKADDEKADNEKNESIDDFDEKEDDEPDKYSQYYEEEKEEEAKYPEKLLNEELEETFIGMLLNNPKAMSMYYILHEDCYFESAELLNIYKEILFTEGQAYAPEIAKRGYNFATETNEMIDYREDLREKYANKNYNLEKIYVELRKLFVIRKSYLGMPIATTQEKIVEIVDYELYDKMSIEEVKAAVEQVTVTQKFKSAVLSEGVSRFLTRGENNLTTGLSIPFKIISSVFKGIRKGETMSFAMPSNCRKK